MIDIRPAIRALLLSEPAITAVVGTSPNDRIYPGVLPQGETQAALVYNLVSEFTSYHMQGGSGLMQARIQVNAWAASAAVSASLGNLVFTKLSGFKGLVPYGISPILYADIQAIFHDNGSDETDTSRTPFRYGRRRDYLFWYRHG